MYVGMSKKESATIVSYPKIELYNIKSNPIIDSAALSSKVKIRVIYNKY